jgi:hypothetical protein
MGSKQMSREAKIERRRLVARRVFEALCAQSPHKYVVLVQPGDLTAERAYHIEQRRPTADHDEPSTISTAGAAMRLAPVWSMLVVVENRARVSFDQ